jgi:hypothetical protein
LKRFRIKADATFFAKNIEDAFEKLAKQFYDLSIEDYMISIFESGTVSVDAIEKEGRENESNN